MGLLLWEIKYCNYIHEKPRNQLQERKHSSNAWPYFKQRAHSAIIFPCQVIMFVEKLGNVAAEWMDVFCWEYLWEELCHITADWRHKAHTHSTCTQAHRHASGAHTCSFYSGYYDSARKMTSSHICVMTHKYVSLKIWEIPTEMSKLTQRPVCCN